MIYIKLHQKILIKKFRIWTTTYCGISALCVASCGKKLMTTTTTTATTTTITTTVAQILGLFPPYFR